MGETEAFFAELEAREHEPLLEHMKGTLLVELLDGDRVDRIYVDVHNGRVTVRGAQGSDGSRESDEHGQSMCAVRVRRELFDDFVTGRVNAMAAFLRCEVEVEGDPVLLLHVGRLFPGPPDQRAVGTTGASTR